MRCRGYHMSATLAVVSSHASYRNVDTITHGTPHIYIPSLPSASKFPSYREEEIRDILLNKAPPRRGGGENTHALFSHNKKMVARTLTGSTLLRGRRNQEKNGSNTFNMFQKSSMGSRCHFIIWIPRLEMRAQTIQLTEQCPRLVAATHGCLQA